MKIDGNDDSSQRERKFSHRHASTRYESILTNYRGATYLTKLLADASRVARQGAEVSSEREQALVEVAAGVTAPALFGYVWWLLRNAHESGIERLYFLSRDGQILLQIAKQLQSLFPCELRYLYGSRAAWSLPSLVEFNENLLHQILPLNHLYTIESSFQRIGLQPEIVVDDLQRIDLPISRWHEQLEPREQQKLHAIFLSPAFQQMVRSQAAASHPMLLSYLQQEGLWDDVPWAIVDLGWHGSLQSSLGRVLAKHNGPQPHGYYYGISGGEPDNLLNGVRKAYLADARQQANAEATIESVFMPLELFCVADHGTVTGYRLVDSRVQPVLQSAVNTPLVDWGLPLVQQTVERFMEALVPQLASRYLEADLRPAIMDILNEFWRSPSASEAHVWGDFWCEERFEFYQLAPPYTAQHLVQVLKTGKFERSRNFWWHNGSLARTPIATRLPLSLLTYTGRMVKRISGWCRKL